MFISNALCALPTLETEKIGNHSCWADQSQYQGKWFTKAAKLSEPSDKRMVFPYNLLLKSWKGSLNLHAFVCFDQNSGTQPIFHQNLLLTDSLGLLRAYLPHCVCWHGGKCQEMMQDLKPTPGSFWGISLPQLPVPSWPKFLSSRAPLDKTKMQKQPIYCFSSFVVLVFVVCLFAHS